jgi:hypothetical protein
MAARLGGREAISALDVYEPYGRIGTLDRNDQW